MLFSFLFSCKKDEQKRIVETKVIEKPKPILLYGFNIDNYNVVHDTIKKGDSFGLILDRHHVMYPKINKIATK